MINAPNMLLIGATGRNAGKTEFACEVIRRFTPAAPVAAAKITVIRTGEKGCPRGNASCGVCGSLDGAYAITAETNRDSAKDTARLLRAGANPVYWLRVRDTHMAEGLAALRALVDDRTPMVCESNSIRHAVEPGLFLMVRDARSDFTKPTARRVAALADRTVLSDGEDFDLDLDRIGLCNARWILREPAAAIIMGGGAGSRMGADKRRLDIGGVPLLEHIHDQLRGHFDEIVLSANDDAGAFLGLETIPDRQAGMGPLMGLASVLETVRQDYAFVVACDMPSIDIHLAHRMFDRVDGHDAVVPRIAQLTSDAPHLEPLFAVYRASTANRMFELLEAGERRMRSFFEVSHTHFFDLEPDAAPRNLNTQEEYRAYVA